MKSLLMGLPLDLGFRTKSQLAIDISKDAAAVGIRPDFYCGDEVYGNCSELREHFEAEGQAYVLRVPSNFMLTLATGMKLTCAEAVKALLRHKRCWEVRSAGAAPRASAGTPGPGSPPPPAPSPAHPPPPQDRELAFHYSLCARRPEADQDPADRRRRLRWPVEEDFEFGKDCIGLDQCQARLYTAILRHAVLVMAALAICAVTAALLKDRTGTQAPPQPGLTSHPRRNPA